MARKVLFHVKRWTLDSTPLSPAAAVVKRGAAVASQGGGSEEPEGAGPMLPKSLRASYCAGYSLFRYVHAASKRAKQAKSSLAPDRRSLLPPMTFSCTRAPDPRLE
ncbi:hypothetical protein GCM10012320_26120 [Sinomonas cellulolyticus]|nr:hypothetical protein GCM10012320_26120 [Sinomonas sp. KCTC 49339]